MVSYWLTIGTLGSVETTPTYTSSVCKEIELEEGAVPGVSLIIEPGAPESSAVFHRVESRGSEFSMPPLGTELVDTVGRDAIVAWIQSLSAISCP